MKENCIEWLETKIELNNRMMLSDSHDSDFDDFLKGDNIMMEVIIDLLKDGKRGGGMSEDNFQNNKCFIDWRGYGEDSEPYCEPCDIELFDEWNHCPSCGRKIYSYIDGKEIVGWP